MANRFFPQLSSGALAQYPLRKTRALRTIRNELADGSLIAVPDAAASYFIWELGYSSISGVDLSKLVDLFNACSGRLSAFTFLDPADNLLGSSTNFGGSGWQLSPVLTRLRNMPDPAGGASAELVTNGGQGDVELSQTLPIPAGFTYCLSVWARSTAPAIVELVRRGPVCEQTQAFTIASQWTRLAASGQLSDAGTSFTAAIRIPAGEVISLYGPQLEAQFSPSRYRPTLALGGVYPNAHWADDELAISADAPDLFSTSFRIETAL